MRSRAVILLVVIVMVVGIPSLCGQQKQPSASVQDGMTRQQADAILQELRQIRALLERQQASARPRPPKPQTVRLTLEEEPFLGKPDAPITLVEYTDYQCPYCNRFHTAVFDDLKRNFIDTGQVRFISRDLPLEFHANALLAAQAARCAGPEKFWAMRDMLIRNASNLGSTALVEYARKLAVDVEPFSKCLASESVQREIRKQAAQANALGLTGTPSFVIGRATKNVMEGTVLVGAQPYAVFEAKINDLVKPKAPTERVAGTGQQP